MKTIVLLVMVILAVGAVVIHNFPQTVGHLPGGESLRKAVSSPEVARVAQDARGAASDVVRMTGEGELGIWHFAILAVAVLIGRKALMWVLR